MAPTRMVSALDKIFGKADNEAGNADDNPAPATIAEAELINFRLEVIMSTK